MEWQEYQKMTDALGINTSEWEQVDVQCPVCGERIYKNTIYVLTTYPCQYKYKCFNCDWSGTAYH